MSGFVEKRGPGRWRARYRGPDGRERSRTFDRKVDSERSLRAEQADVAQGRWVDPRLGRTTFAEYVPTWEEGLVDLRPRTKVLNVGIARNYLLPRFGSWPLNRITKSDVKAMVADEIDHSGLSTSSIRKHVHVLSQILRGVVEDRFIVTNPAEGVKLPVEKRREMRILDPAQVARLADAIGPHYRPMVLTAAYTGLRFGELCGLPIEDVDALRRRITVRQQAQQIDGQMQIVEPKTKASCRVLAVPAALVEQVLAAHLALDPVRRSGMVFPTPSGTIIRPTNFRQVFRRACAQAGSPAPTSMGSCSMNCDTPPWPSPSPRAHTR